MKVIWLYQLLNPGSIHLFGFRIFKSIAVVQIVYLVMTLFLFSSSVYYRLNNLNDATQKCMLFVATLFAIVKLYYVVKNSDKIWKSIHLTSFNVLRYKRHRIEILETGWDKSTFVTTLFLISLLYLVASWILTPLFITNIRWTVEYKNCSYQ